jgi:hypothetical protein
MSNCIIRIKVGNDWITLDPNSNISAENKELLVNALDVNRLRTLYSQVRSGVDFSKDLRVDEGKASEGEQIYNGMVDDANKRGEFLSPVAAIKAAPENQREALSAYLSTLDGNQILSNGNFLLDPKEAYKLSPYTQKDIEGLFFSSSSRHKNIYSLLTNVPGMDTLRMSVAYANDVNGRSISRPTGRYLRPDNIIQVVIPDGYYIHSADDKGVTKANLDKDGIAMARNIIIHELSHAVLSEVYIGDSTFRSKVDDLHKQLVEHLDSLLEADGVKLDRLYKPATTARRNELRSKFQGMRDLYAEAEVGPHEFLSNLLEDKALWDVTNLMVSRSRAYESPEKANLYNDILESLPGKYRNADSDSALKDAIATITGAIPDGAIRDTFEKKIHDYVDPSDKRNMFHLPEGVDEDGVVKHIAPRDQVDSYWSKNEQAYRMQRDFLERVTGIKGGDEVEGKPSFKNAFYKESIDKPTQAQIDQLYKQDLALIPWCRWNGLEDGRGDWVEIGIVLDKKGKPIMDGKKLLKVDITRDAKGNIVQDSKLGTIEERFNHVPVMHSNIRSGTVTVAKVGTGADRAEWKYNSITVPYSFIRGIRKYDYSFFDHTRDYDNDLAEAKQDLIQSQKGKHGLNAKIDWVRNAEQGIENAIANKALAEAVKKGLIDLHEQYTFTRVEDDGQGAKVFHKNVTEEDYLASGWDQKNLGSTKFASPEDAVFTIKKVGKGFIAEPNKRMFQILWQSDSGSEFGKSSTQVADAVTKGDLVRLNKPETVNGVEVARYEWLPVYKKLANGVLVGTSNGKGYIVGFNNIDAYAKNTTTKAWDDLVDKQKNVVDAFVESLAEDKVERKAGREKTEASIVTYKSLQTADESEKDVVNKFIPKDIEYTKKLIQPGYSFVKVMRKFPSSDPTEKGAIERQTNELVVAKTEDGVVTMRFSKDGKPFLDHINYTDHLEDKENYGKQLLFLMEDLSAARDMWRQTEEQQDQFDENNDKNNPSFEDLGNGRYKPLKDFKLNPRNIRDVYDLHANINGVNVSRLAPGDMVGIALPEDSKIPRYFRKVLRVLDDGRIAVVENRKEAVQWKSGIIGKSGVYVRLIDMGKVDRLAYRVGKIEGNKDEGFTSQFHQDIIDRRMKMLEYANADKDWNDFDYAKGRDNGSNFNKKAKGKSGGHYEYVPLTNKLVDPSEEGDEVFLDRNLDAVSDPSKAAMVMAWVDGKAINIKRGIRANTEYVAAKDILDTSGKYPVIKDIVLKVLKPGDWVSSPYVDGKGKKRMGRNPIERIEGGRIYTIRNNMEAWPENLSRISGINLSTRNSNQTSNDGQWAKYKRVSELKKALGVTKDKKSLDLPFKSPKDSRRALMEVGNRLQELNPDINLNYVEQADINLLHKQTGHDYSNARAFVMNGEVYVNTDKASVSDVIHEYAHLFLHAVKYDNPTLYGNIVDGAKVHPLYDKIASQYNHLNESDLNEEVFVTLLGEYMKGSMSLGNKAVMDQNKKTIIEFSEYTKDKLEQLLGGGASKLQNLEPGEILNMRLEDVIGLVGDHIMSNRISDIYDDPKFSFGRDVKELARALKERGFLTEECYG